MKYYDIKGTEIIYRPYIDDRGYCMANLDYFDFVLINKKGERFIVATGEATDETKGTSVRKYVITDVKTGLPFTQVHKYGESRPRDHGTPYHFNETDIRIKMQGYYLTLNNSLNLTLGSVPW